ncbi:MAG: hypothetical protein V7K14_01480 [Nostoc sp.]|uniref:hypothetical protein n=1 Tax=Nostoc sp. TaxID=1180 RepID=UPI002FF5400D
MIIDIAVRYGWMICDRTYITQVALKTTVGKYSVSARIISDGSNTLTVRSGLNYQ